MKKQLILLTSAMMAFSGCQSQNKKPLSQHDIDSLKAVQQIRQQMAHQDSMSKAVGPAKKVSLTDVGSCYQYLNGKYFSNSDNNIAFDVDAHTAVYQGQFNGHYQTNVKVDIRLGGVSYATVRFTDPTGVRQRLPICNLTRDGVMSDETSPMTFIPGLSKFVPNSPTSQTGTTFVLKVDTLTLVSGGGSPKSGLFLYFSDKNKKQVVAVGKIDSAFVGSSATALLIGTEPPLKVDSKFINKGFQVSYEPEDITTPDDNTTSGLKVHKLVLVKSNENKLKGLLNKLSH